MRLPLSCLALLLAAALLCLGALTEGDGAGDAA